MPRIGPVLVTSQHGTKIFTFSLSARQLMALCRIERFGESEGGVNRPLHEAHAKDIGVAMANTELRFLQNLIGYLKGPWEFKGGSLHYDLEQGSYISADDGQHRLVGLRMLLEGKLDVEQLKDFNLIMTVTQDLSTHTRMRIFRMQKDQRPLDSRLELAQRHHLNEWKHDVDREAYSVVLLLNTDDRSPIKGLVQINETSGHRAKENSGDLETNQGISSKGLFASVRSSIGSHSPLANLDVEQKGGVVVTMIKAASEVWARRWNSPDHILSTSRGVNAVLRLIVGGPNFARYVGTDYSEDNIRRVLSFAANFDWTKRKYLCISHLVIMNRLDQSIGRGALKEQRTEE